MNRRQFLGVVVAGVVAGCSNGTGGGDSPDAAGDSPTPAADLAFGEAFELSTVAVVVEDVRTTESSGSGPDSSGQQAEVVVGVENLTESQTTPPEFSAFEIVVSGSAYSPLNLPTYSSDPLSPGAQREGTIVYNTPANINVDSMSVVLTTESDGQTVAVTWRSAS